MTAAFNTICPTRFGRMLVNRNDVYIGQSLLTYGEYSWGEVELFQQLLQPGDWVIEAGANIGAHTVPLAQWVGDSGRVWAIEPQRRVFQLLAANVALNSLAHVHTVQAALDRQPGTVQMPLLDPDGPHNFGGVSANSGTRTETVPATTIDALEVPRCRLLKIDVEGMETAVIEGARATIARCRPVLYVENDREQHAAALIALLRSLGYRLWWHCPPLFNPQNFNAAGDDIFGNIVSRNMLCLPEEHRADMHGFEPVH